MVSCSFNTKISALVVLVLALALTGCSRSSVPEVEVWKDGTYQPLVTIAYEISGKRKGSSTHAVAKLTLAGGDLLTLELTVVYNPKPVLDDGRWTMTGKRSGSGNMIPLSLKFLGGQGEGPSLGGRFRLDENSTPRFRISLPLKPVSQSFWDPGP